MRDGAGQTKKLQRSYGHCQGKETPAAWSPKGRRCGDGPGICCQAMRRGPGSLAFSTVILTLPTTAVCSSALHPEAPSTEMAVHRWGEDDSSVGPAPS